MTRKSAPPPRLSYQGMKILKAFVDAFGQNVRSELAGADIMRVAHVASGTLYPVLVRFESAGLIRGEWEKESPEKLGRPQRRKYVLTSAGAEFARKVFEDVRVTGLMPSEA